MQDFFITLLTFSYGIVGIMSILGYIPTLKDLYTNKNLNINISTYAIWSFTTFVMFLYGIFILKDTLFLIITGFAHIFCLAILLLGIRIQKLYTKQLIKIKK